MTVLYPIDDYVMLFLKLSLLEIRCLDRPHVNQNARSAPELLTRMAMVLPRRVPQLRPPRPTRATTRDFLDPHKETTSDNPITV